MNFIFQISLKSFLKKYFLVMGTLFLLPSCFLLQTDLGKSLQHRMSASCSANPSGCGVSPQVVANIIQTTAPEIDLQENTISYASNSSLDFGGILQGTSSTKTISIRNLGTADLTLTGSPAVVLAGTDATMFTITQPSTTTIAVGATITFTITFAPSSTGAKTASISIANDDLDENNYVINLLGTSSATLAPEINLQENNINYATNSNFDFGTLTQGSQSIKTFTIQNLGTANLSLTGTPIVNVTGTDASMFTINQPSASTVATSSSITFSVTFNPSSTGTKTASISIANNDSDESAYVINLLGTSSATLVAEINLQENNISYASNSNFDFGAITQGTSSVRTFTIQNLGTANLNLTGSPVVNVTGTDAAMFTVTQPTITSFVAGANVTFTVTFNPSSTGAKTASFAIANNDSDESNYIINLTGTSSATPVPEINLQESNVNYVSGSTYDFGDLLISPVTNPKVVTFTIQNQGAANLNLTGSPIVNITGTDAARFTVTQQPSNSTISAAGNTTFSVSFDIGTAGSKNATLSISNNDSDESSYTINLVGTNTMPPSVPDINLQEGATSYAVNSTFNFGSVAQGFDSTKTFTIANVGTATLNLTGNPTVAITGNDASLFEVTQPEITSLNQGNSITFNITFTPELGTKTATISIANNDSDESNYVINLQAEGTLPAPEINIIQSGISYATESTFDFGIANLPNQNNIERTFTIENIGTALLKLEGMTKVEVSGMDANLFTVTQEPQTEIPSPSGTDFKVLFNPQDQGVKTATLTISNNDSDENPYIIHITGTANLIQAPEIAIEDDSKTNYITGDTCDFFNASVGTSIPKTFNIKNSGNANLNLLGTPIIAISGNNISSFAIVTFPSTVISPEGSTQFTIEFTPDSTGEKTAVISISNDDSDENLFIINLKGNGFPP